MCILFSLCKQNARKQVVVTSSPSWPTEKSNVQEHKRHSVPPSTVLNVLKNCLRQERLFSSLLVPLHLCLRNPLRCLALSMLSKLNLLQGGWCVLFHTICVFYFLVLCYVMMQTLPEYTDNKSSAWTTFNLQYRVFICIPFPSYNIYFV